LHPEDFEANWVMASVKRAAAAVAAILVREGVDYAQSKAVFKAARERAGLRAVPEHRGGVDRLTVEEELRFLDRAYAQDGRTGLMLQTLLETGARASELVLLRVEDVSLVERVITIRQGKVLRDNQGENRVASFRNAPERAGHCLTRMLPQLHQDVNRVPI
jgi:integrase